MRITCAGLCINFWCYVESYFVFENYTHNDIPDIDVTFEENGITLEGIGFKNVYNRIHIAHLEDGRWVLKMQSCKCTSALMISPDYKRIVISTLNDKTDKVVTKEILRTALECLFTFHHTLSLHSACVELNGEAICFTGDSGVGKSTRAKAWVDNLGAEFISGDRPAVRVEDKGAVACGVPWDGKEQIFRNVERPLKAVMEVRRSPFTRLRRLTEAQAYKALVRQIFIPMWDTDAAAAAMGNLRALTRVTPVYRVFCGPDGEAARGVYDILFEHPELILEERREMKIKEGFTLRNVVGESIVMPTGENIKKFDGAVVLNEVSAYIYEQLQRPISKEDLLDLILSEFEVDRETAARDLDALLARFREYDMLDEEGA